MWRLPLWTAKVRPTKSGVMVERRDQVLIAGGREAPCRISSTFFSRCRSMNGPFFTERAITLQIFDLRFLICPFDSGAAQALKSQIKNQKLLNSPVAHDHLRGALVLARLVAARRLPPRRHGVT